MASRARAPARSCETPSARAAAAARPAERQSEPFQVLTHCNAGWLATVDWGTALAPIYKAHRAGLNIHVWVDETRPRNQGASLTAFELGREGVPHTVIVDNAGGHLMQQLRHGRGGERPPLCSCASMRRGCVAVVRRGHTEIRRRAAG